MTTHNVSIIQKLKKLKLQADGERKIGNFQAAEAFVSKLNELLLKYELSERDLDVVIDVDKEIPIEVKWVNHSDYGLRLQQRRSLWQEQLAYVLAKANMCKIYIHEGSNQIGFVGTEVHREIAEYTYGVVATWAEKQIVRDYDSYCMKIWKELVPNTLLVKEADPEAYAIYRRKIKAYRQSWLDAFVKGISKRLADQKKNVVGNSNTALIKIDNALVRVTKWMSKQGGKRASKLTQREKGNLDGMSDGLRAANKASLNKGVGGRQKPKGHLN